MDLSQWLFVTAVVIFTIIAAVTDITTRRLPNWLTVPALLAGLVFHTVTAGWSGLGTSLGGFATGFGILLVLWLIGGGGGGDVKLMGALGAWLGPLLTLLVFVLSGVFAVLGTFVWASWETLTKGYGHVRKRVSNARYSHHRPKNKAGRGPAVSAKRRLLPYALPVALGTWLVLAWHVIKQST